MKTLTDICLANPSKVRIANVDFEITSDFDRYTKTRKKISIHRIMPLEEAITKWECDLTYVRHLTTEACYHHNKLALDKKIKRLMSETPESIKLLFPTLEQDFYDRLIKQAKRDIAEGRQSPYIQVETGHHTARITQVYVPAYHAEYNGQSIDVEAEILWANPDC